jgi:hypothetical protein
MVERGRSVQQRLREFQGQLRKILPLVEGLLEGGEVREREAGYTASQEEYAARPADRRFRIEHYGKTPHFALYEDGELLTLTPYKKGAQNVVRRMTELLERIQALEEQLQAVSPPGTSAVERLQAERQAENIRRR